MLKFQQDFNIILKSLIHTTAKYRCKARTYESKPVPGSPEHLDPLRWAEKLFKLKKLPNLAPKAPSILNIVCRIKDLKGIPHYQRAILEKYELGSEQNRYAWIPLKNTPSVNKELNIVKHLIKVKPIEFPQGLPNESTDLRNSVLRSDGRFYLRNPIKAELNNETPSNLLIIDKNPEATAIKLYDKPIEIKKLELNRVYMRKKYNKDWHRSSLLNDMFSSHYKYKLNQDGQEYRYSKLWKLDEALKHSVSSKRNADKTFKDSRNFGADWNTRPWRSY